MRTSRSARRPAGGERCRISRRGAGGAGKAARAEVPRSSHGDWEPAADRRDPVELLEEQAADAGAGAGADPLRADARVAVHVLPRRGLPDGRRPRRRRRAPGSHVQLCGDAHLSNFGGFAAPDRRLVFSINDFDETLPGPFEWDVKRLVASFAVAGRDRGFDAKQRQAINLAVGARVPGGDAALRRRCATSTSGTRGSTSTSSLALAARQGAAKQRQAVRAQRRQGAVEGQPEGVREAHRDRRRRAADRQRPAADRPDRGARAAGASAASSRTSCAA